MSLAEEVAALLPQGLITGYVGVVTSVSGGVITVDVRGALLTCSRNSTYVPAVGDNVMVMRVDTSNSWMIAFKISADKSTGGTAVPTPDDPVGPIASFFALGGTLCTSSGAEVAIPSWAAGSSTSVTFRAGRLYRLSARGGVYDGNGTTHAGTVYVRKGAVTTSGQLLAFWRLTTAPTVGGAVAQPLDHSTYVANTTGADITTPLSMTIIRIIGTSTLSLYGDGNQWLGVDVEYVGPTTSFPATTARAAKIT